MAVIRLKGLSGERPAAHPNYLPETGAQVAKDCRLTNGTVRPLRGQTLVRAKSIAGTLKGLFRYTDSVWFEWAGDVDAHFSPVANDAYARVFYTGDGYPKVTYNAIATGDGSAPYPDAAYKMGVPAPGAAPSVAVGGTATDPNDPLETRYYVCVYVDVFGGEGAPSPVSGQVELRPGQTVNLTNLPAAPAGNYNIQTLRIYRSNTGTSGSIYQRVADVAIGTATYDDTIASADLGMELTSTTFDEPEDTMVGLTWLPQGFFAGFFANVLCFSEPGYPHAWPVGYQLTTRAPIVGIAAVGGSLLVVTTEGPYLASGQTPAAMGLTDLEWYQACVSKRGMVDAGVGAVYPSPDGLVMVTLNGPKILTDGLMDRDTWQALKPSSIVGFLWEGKYLGFYDTGTEQGGFSIDPRDPESGITFYTAHADGGYLDLDEDRLYLSIGGNIVAWDADTTAPATYTWKSKPFHTPRPSNFGACQLLSDAYPVIVKYYADGRMMHTQSVDDELPFRLPDGFLARKHELQLEGSKTVYELLLAETMGELRRI